MQKKTKHILHPKSFPVASPGTASSRNQRQPGIPQGGTLKEQSTKAPLKISRPGKSPVTSTFKRREELAMPKSPYTNSKPHLLAKPVEEIKAFKQEIKKSLKKSVSNNDLKKEEKKGSPVPAKVTQPARVLTSHRSPPSHKPQALQIRQISPPNKEPSKLVLHPKSKSPPATADSLSKRALKSPTGQYPDKNSPINSYGHSRPLAIISPSELA